MFRDTLQSFISETLSPTTAAHPLATITHPNRIMGNGPSKIATFVTLNKQGITTLGQLVDGVTQNQTWWQETAPYFRELILDDLKKILSAYHTGTDTFLVAAILGIPPESITTTTTDTEKRKQRLAVFRGLIDRYTVSPTDKHGRSSDPKNPRPGITMAQNYLLTQCFGLESGVCLQKTAAYYDGLEFGLYPPSNIPPGKMVGNNLKHAINKLQTINDVVIQLVQFYPTTSK